MNPNPNRRSLIITLTVLIVILLAAVVFLLMRKQADAPVLDNSGFTSDGFNQKDQNPPTTQTNTQTSTIPKYEDTPESKVTKEDSPAYLVSFEKRSDGYYYLGLDYLQIKQGEGFVNTNPQIRVFRASPSLKIYLDGNMLNNPGVYRTFDTYKASLVKTGGYYTDTQNQGVIRHTGVYGVYIENGQVVMMEEITEFTEAQGT